MAREIVGSKFENIDYTFSDNHIVNNMYYNTLQDCIKWGYTGLISLECATAMHKLCTFEDFWFPEILYESKELATTVIDSTIYIEFCERVDYTYSKEIAQGLYLADPEQAIVDMIRCERPLEFIYQALQNESLYDSTLLDSIAKSFGVYDLLNKYREEKDCIWDD